MELIQNEQAKTIFLEEAVILRKTQGTWRASLLSNKAGLLNIRISNDFLKGKPPHT